MWLYKANLTFICSNSSGKGLLFYYGKKKTHEVSRNICIIEMRIQSGSSVALKF